MTISPDPTDDPQAPTLAPAPITEPTLTPSVYPGPGPRSAPAPARNRRKDTRQKALEIGQNIRTIRQNRNMTQDDLIALLGHGTPTWLSRIENGHQLITLTILEEVADALQVTLDELRASTPIVQPPDPKIYGPRLRALRKERGWSQTHVVTQLGFGDAKWLSGIETGQHSTRPAHLEKLAQLFNVEVADLIAEPSTPPAHSTNGQTELE